VIREDKFLISHAPYAVDLLSLEIASRRDSGWHSGTVRAVWFRRKSGVLTSHIGTLWDSQKPEPFDAEEFLERHEDGRYGGNCVARWDGESFWGNVTMLQQMKYMDVLVPMLENYPAVPHGFDGWWTFAKGVRS
jgi:hypothetical protein